MITRWLFTILTCLHFAAAFAQTTQVKSEQKSVLKHKSVPVVQPIANPDDPNLEDAGSAEEASLWDRAIYWYENQQYLPPDYPNDNYTEARDCNTCDKDAVPVPLTMEDRLAKLPDSERVQGTLHTKHCVFPVPMVSGVRMTSCTGWRIHPRYKVWKFHEGMDISAPRGTPVLAPQDGCVHISNSSSYGWNAYFSTDQKNIHSRQYSMQCAHFKPPTSSSPHGRIKAQQVGEGPESCFVDIEKKIRGVRVRAGQKIGLVGSTGVSTGPHAHCELRERGRMPTASFPEVNQGIIKQPFTEICEFSQIADKLPGPQTRCNIPRSEWRK